MATKENPGLFDCYAKAAPDEPMFVLLARDPLAPTVVRVWSELRALTRGMDAKVAEAVACSFNMETWLRDHPEA